MTMSFFIIYFKMGTGLVEKPVQWPMQGTGREMLVAWRRTEEVKMERGGLNRYLKGRLSRHCEVATLGSEGQFSRRRPSLGTGSVTPSHGSEPGALAYLRALNAFSQ